MTSRLPTSWLKAASARPSLPQGAELPTAISAPGGSGLSKKRHKYGAKAVEIDGIRFHSKAEGARYHQLKLLERAGKIRGLELQPKFPLVVNGVKVCTYLADFAYFEGERRVWEDVKGHRTREYLIKKRLVEALYPGVTITEVRA